MDPEEQGSWGCEQGESYEGGVTAPGVEDLARFEGVWVGRKMFEVGRKHQKKHRMGKTRCGKKQW